MGKGRTSKIKLFRTVSQCSLEYTDKEFKKYLDDYIEKLSDERKKGKCKQTTAGMVGQKRESEGARVHLRISDVADIDKKTKHLTPKISRLARLQSKSSKNIVRPKSYFLKQSPSASGTKLNKHREHPISPGKICFHRSCNFMYNLKNALKRSSVISECVPYTTYMKLAPVLGLDPERSPYYSGNTCKLQGDADEDDKNVDEFIHLVETEIGIRSDLSEDLQVNPPTFRESVTRDPKPTKKDDNPYLKYLKKISRKSSEEEARQNLGRRSGEITKSIIQDFLEWYKSLGGDPNETSIDESTLQELFQIGFDMPAAKALAIRIKELPTVPESLALLRNEPQHATRAGLRQYLEQDLKAEEKPPRLYAFGKLLPKESPPLRFRPPRNYVRETWLECKRVPQGLDSMETVWGGIENLRSTIAFSNWLKQHPEVTPPIYFAEKGLMKIDYQEWMQKFKGFERDIASTELAEAGKKFALNRKPHDRTKSTIF